MDGGGGGGRVCGRTPYFLERTERDHRSRILVRRDSEIIIIIR